MRLYEERLAAYRAVDFDDLISLPLKLLAEHEHVRMKWQRQLHHVLVDEYQDTNATQYNCSSCWWACKACSPPWATTTSRLWLARRHAGQPEAAARLPELESDSLEQNYRSTSAILRAANNVIATNSPSCSRRPCGQIWAKGASQTARGDNEEHEAERAVARFMALRMNLLEKHPGDPSRKPTWAISRFCIAPITRPAL